MNRRNQNSSLWITTVLLVLAHTAAVKAAPPHDECLSAIVVTAGVPYSDTTVGATGSYWSSCAFNDTLDVWHRFTPTTTGQILISLCGSSFDTTLSVFDGCGGTELACNDDSCGLQSELMVGLTGGQPYYIRVAGYDGDTGSYTLTVTENVQPPPNDECIDAIAVVENTPYEGTTSLATGVSESSCALGDTLDVWHTFTPAGSGYYNISLCDSLFDTTLSVFDVCGGTELACNDDYCDYQSQLSMSLSEAGVYYIRVAGYGGETGDYMLTVTQEVCESPNEPNGPNPAQGTVDVSTDTTLSWNGGNKSIKESKSHLTPKVIYGLDDRRDEYEVSDPALLAVGDATVALVSIGDLTDNGDGTYSLSALTFAEWYELYTGYPLCPDEPYRDQPNPAWCSGFLVAPDIVATAGHCVTSTADCSDTAFIFGFVMLDANTAVLTIDASQVYFCSEIIARQESAADWGLIRLDREVTDHTPLPVRRTGKVEDGADVLVIGHPVGLPRKYAGGATVRDNSEAEYFQANVDTYGGNSGSAVFDAGTMVVEGILVRGNIDFVEDGACDRSNVCPDTGCPWWEGVTRATEFSSFIPSFDVYLGKEANNLSVVCPNSVAAGCDPGPLECGRTYYWQVIAKNHCGQTAGALWWFRTDPSGDMDRDCDVDLPDFSGWAAHWKDNDCDINNDWCNGADLSGDGIVDFNDLRDFAAHWLMGK
jgi:hypothetical protein